MTNTHHTKNITMSLSILNFLFTLFLLSILTFIFIATMHNKSKNSKPIGPKTYLILGNLLELLKNRNRFLEWITEILVDSPTQTFVLRAPLASGIITANPLNVEYMLKTNFHNFPKGDYHLSIMEDLLGHGIFNSNGEFWKAQRKTASFEFNSKSLRNFVTETVQFEITQRLLPLLESTSTEGKVIDLQDTLQRFTFDNICKVAFDVDPASLAEEQADQNVPPNFMEAFDAVGKLNVDRLLEPLQIFWKIKKFLNIGSERQLKESIKIVHNFTIQVAQSRKGSSPLAQKNDILSRFAADNDRTDEFLRDVVTNFIIAGRETTSSALTWFFWLLSTHPDVNAKVVNEIKSVRSKNPNPEATFSFDELRDMHYLQAAITETLRLYPPVPVDSVTCRDGDVMPDGTLVGRGWNVTYSAFSMGRMKTIWGENCCEFRPERWLTDGGVFKPESPFRFTAFHAGPRMCLGKEMAYVQMKSIAACVLERFEVEVVKEKPAEYLLSFTLRMKGGLPIRVRKIGE